MSLDVYLEGPEQVERECVCPECFTPHTTHETPDLYWANITHNLGKMAHEAGIYEALWRPGEIGVKTAKQLVPLLEVGLATLAESPARFRAFDPPNGWGSYDGLVRFVADYINACRDNPDAIVRVSR